MLGIFKFGGNKKSDIIGFANLSMQEGKKEKSDDLSKIDPATIEIQSPSLVLENALVPQIPVIGVGSAGIRITSHIANRCQSYGVEFPTMGIDFHDKDMIGIKYKLILSNNLPGTGKQFLRAQAIAEKSSSKIKDALTQYLSDNSFYYSHELVFIILGSGGTGLGVSLKLIEILKQMGKRPVPFLILPSLDESSIIQFNAAAALYYFTLAPPGRSHNLSTIIIDNEYLLSKYSKKNLSNLLSEINERVGSTIADLILTAELESDGYAADINEFLEIFRDIKSLGTLTYIHMNSETLTVAQIFDKIGNDAHSIPVDITNGTRSYLYLQAGYSQITAKDYRDLINKFNNIDIFPKLHEVDPEHNKYELRAITTGLAPTKRILDLMEFAEDVRVTQITTENDLINSGKGIQKIDRLSGDHDLEVKTGEELSQEMAEEFAKTRRADD